MYIHVNTGTERIFVKQLLSSFIIIIIAVILQTLQRLYMNIYLTDVMIVINNEVPSALTDE